MDKSNKITFVQEKLALDWKCNCNVFKEEENIFIKSENHFFDMITFGKNAVIKVDPSIYNWCVELFSITPAQDIMDGDNLFAIEMKLREFGKKLAGEHTRYLYLNKNKTICRPSSFQYKFFDKTNINTLYGKKGFDFDNALNYQNDVIAFGAYKEDQLVALAGADDGMEGLWQIGIDTLPEYRNRGPACYLVKNLADEIERQGVLPYYTTWSPNIASTTVALKSGFSPVWVQYYSVDI
ncbi:GNAT family N-acetyltransferase [Clostridium butanoliproducens]|uniref:GNAT family N-acetyltransferase n=1 Tax=Clostridium butanoliproducens TaxID=2991837 RepID=UPI0024B96B22|nr:GNAT family N-acetyltransferase [Clostridium butanoliproducens]MDU1348760.1 GNAT family N-acetyltransferase [Clostridium argentinense]